jgi:hypothetical protein
MTRAATLARIEARHLARSPLLWLGFGLALGLVTLMQVPFMAWPMLTGDDLLAYQTGFWVSGGMLLAGAWLGLRDRTNGAADLVAVTPTAPWRLVGARLAAIAAVAIGAFAVAFATALAVSAIRGGRGIPELRLLADGALAVTLGGWVGMAVGWRSGSRMLSVLAAPVWLAACQIVGGWPSGLDAPPSLAVERLSPLLGLTEHSAEFGFLPDPLWLHLGYLLGLLLLAGVGLLALAARGRGQRPPVAPLLAAMLAGVILVTAGGVGLVTLPRWLVVLGPDPADWKPASEVSAIDDRSWTYPDDGHARSCAGDATLTACVYPAYGQRLAGEIHGAMGPVAELFAGLPGVPTRARMVPTQAFVHSACRGSEVQIGEPDVRALSGNAPSVNAPSGGNDNDLRYIDFYLRCALGERNWGGAGAGDERPSEAADVVKTWALVASSTMSREELRRVLTEHGPPVTLNSFSPELAAAAWAMAALPTGQVRAELAPLWERLRAGTLPVSELPGQRP